MNINNFFDKEKNCIFIKVGKRMLFFNVLGNIPSKKNQKQIVYVKGRPLILPSKAHEAWHKDALQQLRFAQIKPLKLQDIQIIICTIYPPTMRKYDLSNKFESIADLLVDYGLLEDDNADILSKVLLFSGGKDATNPRAEVVIFH